MKEAFLLCVLLLEVILPVGMAEYNPSLAESLLQYITDEMQIASSEPRDRRSIYKEYDFIIVGAGSAGCVVANRLSEMKKWSVLLIEAGGEALPFMDVPAVANYWQFSDANWKYKTQPSSRYCLGMENRQCHWPRGKVMGGSSILNYMIYTRGNKMDYDLWEKMGNKGWNWESVLPYFEKLEGLRDNNKPESEEVMSRKGFMSLTKVPYKTPIGDAFLKSATSMGYPSLDYNSSTPSGFEYLLVSMKNGTRYSSSRAFLHSVHNRPNLHVKKRSLATRVLIDPSTKTATGVEFFSKGQTYVVRARKEVILSGGAINSPHLLMLSGVGPKMHLAKKKINVIQDLKVGYNLHDHYFPGGLTFIIKKPFSTTSKKIFRSKEYLVDYLSRHLGPLSSPGGCEALGFMKLGNVTRDEAPNIEILLVTGSINSDWTLYKNFNLNQSLYEEQYKPLNDTETISAFPVLLSSRSRGRIMLRDNNPFHHPLIYPNYFSDPEYYDMKTTIAGIRKTIELFSMAPLRALGTEYFSKPLPQCMHHRYNSDEYWDCYARHMTFTIYHPVGTCKMGPDSDPNAVVDHRLRVRGIRNLRVIDASIMPVIVRAHTNAPTYMIGEKGADMIKEDWGVDITK